jgi:hypothetical protein
MKKIILMVFLLLSVGWTTAFANDDPKLDPRVEKAFKKEFPAAQYITWTEVQEYLKAVFVLVDNRVEAWFSVEGELLATARDILYNQLPLVVMKEVEKKFPASETTVVSEINNSNGTFYRLMLEASNKKYRINVTPNGEIAIVEKIKK